MHTPPAPTLLLTGFESFGEFTVNPSAEVVRELDGKSSNGLSIAGRILPVVFGEAGDALISAMEETNPCLVICLGLAADRQEISIERLAVNLDDARMPDNAGNQPVDQPIERGAPPACWSTLPVKDIVGVLAAHNLPASLSLSAGTFVCNHVFYRLMRHLEGNPAIRGGFIHLPLPDGRPAGFTPDTLLAGIRHVLDAVTAQPLT